MATAETQIFRSDGSRTSIPELLQELAEKEALAARDERAGRDRGTGAAKTGD